MMLEPPYGIPVQPGLIRIPLAKPKWAVDFNRPLPQAVVAAAPGPEVSDEAERALLEDLELWGVPPGSGGEPQNAEIPAPHPVDVLSERSAETFEIWELCDCSSVETQCELEHKDHPRLKQVLGQLNTQVVRRLPICERRHIEAVRSLATDFPHCAAAIELIARHLTLLAAAGAALRLPPLLLTGAPGVGKTEFARRLGQVLGMSTEFRSCAEITASFVITGSSRSWATAQPGFVASKIAELEPRTAPLFVMDELDKIFTDSNFPPDRALLGLLERRTAAVFRDECLELELDTRPVSWIFTCNRLDQVRPELRSRLRIVEIPRPTAAQMPAVVRSVDKAMRRDTPAYDKLFEPLGPEIIEGLSGHSPRIVGRLLEDMFALACEDAAGMGSAKRRVLPRHMVAALASHAAVSGTWTDPHDGVEGLRMPIGFSPR